MANNNEIVTQNSRLPSFVLNGNGIIWFPAGYYERFLLLWYQAAHNRPIWRQVHFGAALLCA